MTQTDLLIWGMVIHLVCDWLLQNHWMATNKATVGHPAGLVHAFIHLVGLSLIFPFPWGLILGVTHYIIDLRFPLIWWRATFRQTTDGPFALHVAIWGDQVSHIALIAAAALLAGAR